MKFEFPQYLYGLFLVAIPIIVHLFSFRKRKRVVFSNTAFLKDIQIQTSSRRTLRERLILLLRILSIIFIVLAFAKPYFPKQAEQAKGQKIISIYVDNSYSMEAVNQDGILLDEARRKAAEVVAAFDLTDKFMLITNEMKGEESRLLTKDEFLSLLDSVEISPAANDINSVIRFQAGLLENYPHSYKSSFLISDFQKNQQIQPIDSLVNFPVHFVKLKANDLSNIAVDSVWFEKPLNREGEQQQLIVRCANYSDQEVKNIPITLWIDDQQKAIGTISLSANQNANDTLSFSGLSAGWHQGMVKIKDQPVVFDDEYRFAFESREHLDVTVISRDKAFDPVSLAYSTDDFFNLHAIRESEINYHQFNQQGLIVLNSLPELSSGLAQQLTNYIKNGGQVAVFLPAGADLSSYQSFLKNVKTDYPVNWQSDTLRADFVDWKNPLMTDILEKEQQNYDLPLAYGFYKLSKQTTNNRQVFISGQRIPLWSSYSFHKGHVYLAAFLLDRQFSNFASHGLFLPILFKMAMQGNFSSRLAYETGTETVDFNHKEEFAESEVLHLKGEHADIIPSVEKDFNGAHLFVGSQIRKAGFYRLQKGEELLSVLAFNDSRKESIRAFLTEDELESLFKGKEGSVLEAGTASVTNQIKEVNLGLALWKLCLILALLCLAAEVLLIRFLRVNKIQQANN